MPPPRPYWKGYLKLSLVSCPISVYSATSAGERVAFRQINKETGNRPVLTTLALAHDRATRSDGLTQLAKNQKT